MRKTLVAAALLALSANIAGAAESVDALATRPEAAQTKGQAKGVGVAWIGKSGMANRVIGGFEERMAEIAPEMEIEINRDLPDADALAKSVETFSAEREGLVVLRSNGSKWLAKHPTSLPTFIGGGNHPPTLGVVENMEAPEGNITGVTYFLDHTLVMEIFVALAPTATRVALITQNGHAGKPVDEAGVAKACEELYLECTFHSIDSAAELADTVKSVDADAFVIGNQAPIYDDAEAFAKAVKAAGRSPIFALARAPVKFGALASMSPSDHKLGRMLADRVVAVVRDGQEIKDTPIGQDPEPTLVINADIVKRMRLEIPRQILEISEEVTTGS